MKAIFDTKPISGYDDDTSAYYQFPRRYLPIVQRVVGDWVVLRRPRAGGGNLAYFAAARVNAIDSDPKQGGMSYARLTDFLPFDRPVPWTLQGRYSEEALRKIPRAQVGVFLRGRSVRALTESDFAEITTNGFLNTFSSIGAACGIAAHSVPPDERAKKVCQALINRIVRDANFRSGVCRAYGSRCALTGLRMLDIDGNCEVQAAHIFAVADGGPDVVQNGLALCGTFHWLFDHHLISLTDDHRLLVAEERIPRELRSIMVQPGEKILLPMRTSEYPHPKYIQLHRQRFMSLQSRLVHHS